MPRFESRPESRSVSTCWGSSDSAWDALSPWPEDLRMSMICCLSICMVLLPFPEVPPCLQAGRGCEGGRPPASPSLLPPSPDHGPWNNPCPPGPAVGTGTGGAYADGRQPTEVTFMREPESKTPAAGTHEPAGKARLDRRTILEAGA